MDEFSMNRESFPMHIVLFEMDGDMQELFLPAKAEGRYQLHRGDDSKRPIIDIMEVNGQWEAVCRKGGSFILGPEMNETRIKVKDRNLVNVMYRNERYALYAECVRPDDSVFVPYYISSNEQISIGRKDDQDICYPSDMVSREHALIYSYQNRWCIKDCDSRNGVYLNGKKVTNSYLNPGDTIYIMGLYIIFGVGFIAMNNANGRVKITSLKLGKITDVESLHYLSPNVDIDEERYFDRAPRRIYEYKPIKIPLEMPPMPLSKNGQPMIMSMANPLISGGSALMQGNALGVLTSLILPAVTQGYNEKEKKDYEDKRRTFYFEYLNRVAEAIQNEKAKEESELNNIYPDINTVLTFVDNKERLWERRKFDSDYLKVRLGTGWIPMLSKVEYPAKRLQMVEDELQDKMYELGEDSVFLENVPVMLSLKDDYVVGIKGEHDLVVAQVARMIIQLALSHSYDDMKIILLARPEDAEKLNFIRYLHHNWDNEMETRFLCTSKAEAQAISKMMNKEVEILSPSERNKASDDKNHLNYVVFALDKELYDCIEAFKEFQQGDNYCNFSIVAAFDGLPKECKRVIVTGEHMQLINMTTPEEDDIYYRLEAYDEAYAQKQLRTLYGVEVQLGASGFKLPNMLTFLEMFNAGKVEHLNPLGRWKENNPVRSLAVPLGVGTDGKPFMLDLHEKHHGPHGLIAGGTGSGKSEFIITYILSLALNFSPDEVAFILIDYKGGGLADAFVDPKKGIHLPHVVGTITNLDGSAISRSMLAIDSEIKRRQAVFKAAKSQTNEGTMDIYDYQRLYRAGKVDEPMPHLFIISDEFAELKKNQPEFMDGLISIARIGRSLGVHLILATQKPTGVVNDQIWTNTKFRICLRVADKNDSMEMLKRPEAAEIRQTGRFYLQVGYNELFEMGQSAWCGAKYAPQDETIEETDQTVEFVDNVGQVYIKAQPQKEVKQTGIKQIVAIVQYLSDLAKRENIIPRKLWTDPIPEKLELDAVVAKYPREVDNKITALIGVVDDPEHQTQYPYYLDMQSFHHLMISAPSGSGKSNYFRTMLLNLVDNYSPEDINYYIVDLSGGSLLPYSKLPHCGVYLSEKNEADLDRLFDLITDIIEERKSLFASAEVTNFDAYRKVAKLPVVLVIFDGFTNIQNFKKGMEYYSSFYEKMREGASYGVKYLVSINHLNEFHTKSRQEVDYKVAFQAKDAFEYGDILDTKCHITVPQLPGRGIIVYDDRPLEFHVAVWNVNADEQEQNKLLKSHFAAINEKYADIVPAKSLPMVEDGRTYADFHREFSRERFPLGYYMKTMKPVALPLHQLSTMTFYFGNPLGCAPVIRNLLYSANQDNMEIIVYRRSADSIFGSTEKESIEYRDIRVKDTTLQEMLNLNQRIKQEIMARNIHRDMYCEMNGIPKTDKSRVRKAAKFIRERTKPLLVFFEGLGDLARLRPDENIDENTYKDIEATLKIFFGGLKGYNIYFMGCMYPSDNDAVTSTSPLLKDFTANQLCMLFGGNYNKADFVKGMPSDVSRNNKIDAQYDKCILKYQDSFYSMKMPCGELIEATDDPDEASIV